MEYNSRKDKLPKGLSYPLKKSLLDPLLEAAGVQQVMGVSYLRNAWRTDPGKLVLRAVYCGEGNCGWYAAGTSSIYVFSVPSPSRKVIEDLLVAEALPRVASWLHDLEHAGNTRRGESLQFAVGYADGRLVLSPQ